MPSYNHEKFISISIERTDKNSSALLSFAGNKVASSAVTLIIGFTTPIYSKFAR